MENNENVTMNENMTAEENQVAENITTEDQMDEYPVVIPFNLWLYLKVAVCVILGFGFIVHAWNNGLRAFWMYSVPQWFKTLSFWTAWLEVSYEIYKKVARDKFEKEMGM